MSRYVEFVEFGFKNFFRYGSNWTKFDFKTGLINVFGNNGIGKSTLVEAMFYNLFGESYRGITLPKLVNKTNKKGLETYHKLRVHENGNVTEYLIIRGIGPKIEKIFVNDSDTPENFPGRFNTYIAEFILGFNSNTYQKVISVHAKNGSFISMSLDERRKIIDSIVNLTKTKDYLKVAKTLLSENNTNKSILQSDISFKQESLKPYKLIISKDENNNSELIEEYKVICNRLNIDIIESKNIIDKYNLEIDGYAEEINSLTEKENELKSEYMKHDPSKLNDNSIKLNSKLMYIKNKVKEIKSDISKIIPNSECGSCGNSYSEEQASKKKEELNEKLKLYIDDGKKIHNQIVELSKLIENAKIKHDEMREAGYKVSEVKEKISRINYSIKSEEHKILINNRNLEEYTKKIAEVGSRVSDDIENIKKTVEEIEAKISELSTQLGEVVDNIESLQYIIKMFSDDGIKALVLKKFLPILNRLINFYLKTFEIPLNFEITSDYGYQMSTTDTLADDFDGLSGGQQQRINLAILFAQTDLIKIIGNFKTNLLFLDEYIDGAVDHIGLEDTFKVLKQITNRDDKSIVVISHRLDDNIIPNFDYFYHATKFDDKFSKLDRVSLEYVYEFKK